MISLPIPTCSSITASVYLPKFSSSPGFSGSLTQNIKIFSSVSTGIASCSSKTSFSKDVIKS